MDAISLLKCNLSSLISANTVESKSIAKKLGINLEELLEEPIKQRTNLINFLKSFELTMPSIIDRNFQPIQLAKFKKANNEVVSTTLIENLKMIAILFREQELIHDKKAIFVHEYYRLNDNELIEQVFKDLDYQLIREQLSNSNEVECKYIFNNLIQKIYDIYGLKIFILEAGKTPFNFDGIYFDKTIATTFVNAYNSAYSKTLFSLLHEMYHFFRDQGNSNSFDLFSESDKYDEATRSEDIRANKFAINFLLYKSSDDINRLKTSTTIENTSYVMQKYGVSKQALGIEIGKDLRSIKIGNLHKCFFNYSKKQIIDLLQELQEEGRISIRTFAELKGSIVK